MAAESGRKAVAGGKVEKGLAEKWEMQERMQNQAEQDAYAVYEEDEANIQNLLSRGMISDEEARRLRTRAKMHMDDQQKKNTKCPLSHHRPWLVLASFRPQNCSRRHSRLKGKTIA